MRETIKQRLDEQESAGVIESSGVGSVNDSGAGGGSSYISEERRNLTGFGSGSGTLYNAEILGTPTTNKNMNKLRNDLGGIAANMGLTQIPGEGIVARVGRIKDSVDQGLFNTVSKIENVMNNDEEFKEEASQIPSYVGGVQDAGGSASVDVQDAGGYGIDFNLDGGIDRVELAISKAGSNIIKQMRVLQPRLRDIARKRIKPESVGNQENQVNLVQQGYGNYTKDFEMFSV